MNGNGLQNGARRCAFVIRVSTEEQALNKEGSLTNQLQRLTAHVEYKRTACGEDWREAGRYVLRGVSGKDSLRSPEFDRLFRDIEAGKVNTVLCTALDRVCRSVKDFLHFFEFLNEHAVEFVCLKQNYDTTSSQGRLFITIMMALAEFEREQTAERNKDATLARAERGLWNGGQILGYDLDPDRPGNLVPNEEERAAVQFAFDTYLECGSIGETAKRMNARGYRTKEYESRRGRRHPAKRFWLSSVQTVLLNAAYVGKKEINKKKRGKDQEALPEAQCYRRVDAVWEPIIDHETFDRVQELLTINGKSKHNSAKRIRHAYLLNSGLLECGHCGSPMGGRCGTGSKGIKYFYYVCTNHDCDFKVPADDIEGIVIQRIRTLATSPDMVKKIVAATNKRLRADLPKLQERGRMLERKLAEVQGEADGLMEQLTQHPGDGGVFVRERLDALAGRRREMEMALAEVSEAIGGIESDAIHRDRVVEALGKFSEVFDALPPYKQRELVRLTINKAIVSMWKLELALYGRPTEEAATRAASRSGAPEWLPGSVAECALLWDRAQLVFGRAKRGMAQVRAA